MPEMTADEWTSAAIEQFLRPIFRQKGWPLPDLVRAKQNHHPLVRHTKVIPEIDQDDGYAIVRYPSSLSHAERVIPAILKGLYRLALRERGRKGPLIMLDHFERGGRYAAVRDHIGLTDAHDELTTFGVATLRRIDRKLNGFPEGSSHPRPAKRHRPTTFPVACASCGEKWFRQSRPQFEISLALGGFHCLLADCGGTMKLLDDLDYDEDDDRK